MRYHGLSPLARSRLAHSVSINNHVSGTDAGTAETASAHAQSVTEVPIAERGSRWVLALFDAHQATVQGRACGRLMPGFQLWHTIVNMARARDHGRVASWTGHASRRRVGP